MPWYRSDDGQTVYHVLIRGKGAHQACRGPALEGDNQAHGPQCGRPAPYLCDAPVDVTFGRKAQARTCDAPMCERHRTNVGPNRDLCWKHAPAKEAGTR